MLEKLLNAMKEDVLKTDFGNRQVMEATGMVGFNDTAMAAYMNDPKDSVYFRLNEKYGLVGKNLSAGLIVSLVITSSGVLSTEQLESPGKFILGFNYTPKLTDKALSIGSETNDEYPCLYRKLNRNLRVHNALGLLVAGSCDVALDTMIKLMVLSRRYNELTHRERHLVIDDNFKTMMEELNTQKELDEFKQHLIDNKELYFK